MKHLWVETLICGIKEATESDVDCQHTLSSCIQTVAEGERITHEPDSTLHTFCGLFVSVVVFKGIDFC